MNQRKIAVLAVLVLTLSLASVARAGSTYAIGDVFVAVTGTGVEEYTAAGTLVQTINDPSVKSSGFITGMAFQNNGNLLVTGFTSGNVVQFDNAANLLNATWTTGAGTPESIAIDATGHVYVSSVAGAGIHEYNSTGGAAIGTSIAGTRTDWIDLAADEHTMLYSDEGAVIHSVNVATNTKNPDFGNTTGTDGFALRILPTTSAFAGDVLVAAGNKSVLMSADGTTILKNYTGGGVTGLDFALNIDPNGTAFWTADTDGHVAEFDIATGTVLQHWTAAGGSGETFGLVVFGQQTASGGGGGGGGGGTGVPEPSTLSLLLGGMFTLGGFAKRRLLR